MRLSGWTVEYPGFGSAEVTVPHAWGQDVPVSWEGPALYRCEFAVPSEPCWLVFEGVSYRAVVRIDGAVVCEHRGIWTAFKVPLSEWAGRTVVAEVEVTKNGGSTFPAAQVASGFLPFVFHTFGGIYRSVYLVCGAEPDLTPAAPAPIVSVSGSQVLVDGLPFYTRGVLTWGWYPALGHPNPPEEVIRREVELAKELGFNLIKFCLWVPSHRYLEILEEEGLYAWLELPIWDPSTDSGAQEQIVREVEEIVLQYRRHRNIIFWTAGCELNRSLPAQVRQSLYELIKMEAGAPLVKDNSGGSEMYGADPVEFGDFYDFHPYCETNFYPPVLDSLLPGPRPKLPMVLGEFNDCDVHRDLHRLKEEQAFWASSDERLNAQGVRWQYDLPGVLRGSRFAEVRMEELAASSRSKAIFVRKFVQEQVRAREDISGFVITGWKDTPVSSSGFVDDWDGSRFTAAELASWNGESCLFLIPQRRPPWIAGGNRPGWSPLFSHFAGQLFWRVGIHSERGSDGRLRWELRRRGEIVASGEGERVTVDPLSAIQIGEISAQVEQPGQYQLSVEFDGALNSWPIRVFAPVDFSRFINWGKHDPAGLLEGLALPGGPNLVCTSLPSDWEKRFLHGQSLVLLMREEGTLAAPFWRESAYEYSDEPFWSGLGFRDQWEQWLDITPDRVLDPNWVAKLGGLGKVEILLNRVDVRTYRESPLLVRVDAGVSRLYATSLRPFGGLGISPAAVTKNPVGAFLLSYLMQPQG